MNRPIKFRGKTINEGEWIYGMTISHGTIARKRDKLFMEVAPDKWKGIAPDTVGQFTGLTDKNGKEIYEGDVILQQGYSGKKKMLVRFEHGAFVTGEHSGSSTAIRPMLIQKRCEVLGNIHDNPSLLKGGSHE